MICLEGGKRNIVAIPLQKLGEKKNFGKRNDVTRGRREKYCSNTIAEIRREKKIAIVTIQLPKYER